MLLPISTLPETTDYNSSPGMSELDGLSDSDWLDIASGHDSDNDSLSDESEGEPLSRPLSRQSSSISIGSSRGEVEAWEGFVEPNNGEGAAALIPDIVTDQDIAEDELVKEALNQSLIGTLNSSRTSTSSSGHSGSNQASVRDLRLSFPDPLNSPRNELELSYQEVSVDEHEEHGTDTSAVSDDTTPVTSTRGPLAPEIHEVPTVKVDFQIHLYGSSTECKWTVVQDFLQKVADGSGQFLIDTLDPTNEKKLVHTAVLGKVDADSKPLFNAVRIYDRTEDDRAPDIEVNNPIDCPSLGIVFLPANRLPTLAPHTAYISVLANDYIADVMYNNDKALRNAAEDDWELLNLSPSQTLNLKTPERSPVINHQDVKSLDSRQVYRALQAILYEDEVVVPKEHSFKGQATPAKVIALSTVVSVLLTIALNASSFRSPAPTPTVNISTPNNTWTSLASLPNRSASVAVHSAHGKTQVMFAPARDAAVSLYNPGTTALSLTPETEAATAPPVTQPRNRKPAKVALSDKPTTKEADSPEAPTFASEESATSSFLDEDPEAEYSTDESDLPSDSSATVLGMNFVNSLSEALGVTTKSIVKAVNEDMEILDDLMSVIKTQTDDLIKQSKGKARALGDHVQAFGETIQYRNERARTRAKQLRRRSGEFFTSASEHVRDRTNIAKDRARRVRETVEEGHAWDYYKLAHHNWADRLYRERKHRTGGCFRKRDGRGRREDRYMDTSYSGCT